jgi:hypothetical protein
MSKQRGKGRAGGKGRGGDDEPEDSPKGRKGRVVEEETNDIPTRKKGGRRGKAEEDAVPKKGQKKVCIFAFISDQQQLFFFFFFTEHCFALLSNGAFIRMHNFARFLREYRFYPMLSAF